LPADKRSKTERLSAAVTDDVARAASLLASGATVAFPTETVYGLGATALDRLAVARIFAAKQRPGWDPLIVHVDGPEMLAQVALLPAGAEGCIVAKLIEAFWPGPLTLLLPRTHAVPDAVTAGRPLVGVRMPAHPVALELIGRARVPIAAPSANRFGHTSPTSATHVLADLDGRIAAVLDGGPTSVGVESTVLDVAARAIYRPGAVTAEMISRVIGEPVRLVLATSVVETTAPEALASPGMGMRHYAPRARLVLVADERELQAEIARHATNGNHAPTEIGVMLPDGWSLPDAGTAHSVWHWGVWDDAETLAQRLFAGLRHLDEQGVKTIICPMPMPGGLREALRDRLEKAARVK
jgi:L-threonylcarbamoyladenylate synthase